MSESLYAGSVSQSIDVFLQSSAVTNGGGLTGLVFNSAGLVASYRKGATGSRVAITLATQTVGGAYSSGGFVEVDATHLAGVYRFDVPNAAIDTEGFATLYFYGATNLVVRPIRIDCRPFPADAKKLGGTVQTGRDIGASVLLSAGTGTGQLDFTAGVVKANWVQILASAITGTAAQLAAAITKFFNVATPTGTVNSLPDAVAGAASGVAIVGSAMTLSSGERTTLATAIEAALINEADGQMLLDAIGAKVQTLFDNGADVPIATLVIAIRDAILNRVLSGNHDTAGTPGKLLQNADVAVSSRATPADVLAQSAAALDTISTTALARFIQIDTGALLAAPGSVAIMAWNTAVNIRNAVGLTSANLNTQLAAISGVTAKLDTGLVLDGADWQFTVNMLELGPAGGGGGGGLTAEQQAQLDAIEAATARLRGAPINVISNVGDGGLLRLTLGDDHETVVENSLPIVVSDPGGMLHARLTAVGTTLQWKAGQDTTAALISGTVSGSAYDSGAGETTITVEVANCAATGNTLAPYKWQLQRTVGGRRVRELQGTLELRQDMLGS